MNGLKLVACHQPGFLPWAGFWNKAALATDFVLLGAAKWSQLGFFQRVRLNESWLTLPVTLPQGNDSLLKDVRLARDPVKVCRTLRQTVLARRNPYRDRLTELVVRLEQAKEGDFLLELNVDLLRLLGQALGLDLRWHLDLKQEVGESKTERLARVVARYVPELGVYLNGAGAAGYIQPRHFPPGVRLWQQELRLGVPPDSVLQSIAATADPLAGIREAASWAEASP